MSSLDSVLAPWVTVETGIRFNNMALDSRKIEPGDLFVAVQGHLLDGRDFIEAAIAKGAVAILCQADQSGRLPDQGGVPVVGIRALPQHLSAVALRAYPQASEPRLVGVTGTNGKTTVTQLYAQLRTGLDERTGVMGTVGNGLWGQLTPSANTTSDAVTVAATLAAQAQAGASAVAMEISSHGLSQNRVSALPIEVAVFTNLSRDHLDYHGDMESYAEAKRQLFSQPGLQGSVLNLDDEYGSLWHRQLKGQMRALGYSIDGARCEGDYLTATDLRFTDAGVEARLESSFGQGQLRSPLLGKFNLANLLAALGALLMQGYPLADLLAQVAKLQPAAGRMERYQGSTGPTLVVDYAHTPDALEQALSALRHHCQGQLWCLFGCGGERDRGKRPMMAQSAERFADRLVITADNPRSEAFDQIVQDMLPGLQKPDGALVIEDRAEAVRQAYQQAADGDLILLAGKGHEDYQLIQGKTLSYNERHLAQALTGEEQ
ncbi:UDP-N-acetylmuramoyl-L-alanyl-D-glutamate--2,6-diaminopimelate ligase [Ferrimonas marina]|uniref:UDP-N-acetylmuramoyl-L-alanyl-D-glutamate--2,6-diaminopimelate ligase n=1 Tax=Ferrimonas marina TaxID=299255 RepID=A0A1M5XFV0_9GAMM|nr:UDP-N-acetylmuramoyl-L-alanyl-D-glutamate--2,6-diaminopimelate ligase [Ferrimonas marina]SHH98700.1 UDP-N-acetylmuramoylalanyl-D-glutamate--2,6-diaminopimelate ligase [Ferrimonas marina]